MSKIQELLCVTSENKRIAREIYKKSEEDINKDLDILLEWLGKQPHLPKYHDKTRLEACLLRNKFRVEQTKIKLDKYYTYRGIYTDFFVNLDPTSIAIERVRRSILWVPMPKLSPTMERITVIKLVEKLEDLFNVKDLFTYMLMILDLQLKHDYAVGERYVFDISTLTMKHIFKMEPSVVTKGFLLSEQAFSGRIVGIDYINLPATVDYALTVLKQILDAKIFNKITTYKSLESFYKVVPKEYLPEELGGDQESIYTLHDKWGKELIRQKDYLDENALRVSNENLRVGKPIHNELFGVEGTFKKINLD